METTKDGHAAWYYRSISLTFTASVTDNLTERSWTKYRDIEIDMIEDAFQNGEPYLLLDEYRLDLVNFIQMKLDDETQRWSIKREPILNQSDCLRSNRFYTPPAVQTSAIESCASYGAGSSWCPFLREWLNSPAGKRVWFDFPSCIEACADGIIQEAPFYGTGNNAEAAYMANKMRQCLRRPRQEASKLAIKLYTRDSFLYFALNKAVRDFDLSKVATLGPLCYLIRDYSSLAKEYIGTVYRGVQLSYSDIQDYRKATGTWKTWPAYTSTSKNRKLAELYGNTLFIIEFSDCSLSAPRSFDITHFSSFPDEEEVLLPAGSCFKIINVDYDPQQKLVIHVKL